jgi:hypothetical protein
MKVRIADIVTGDRVRTDFGDLAAFAESIKQIGLLQPIAINDRNELCAGARRILACKRLGWDEIEAHVVTNIDDVERLLRAEIEENTCRKDFNIEESVNYAQKLEAILKPQAQAAMSEGRKSGGKSGGNGRKSSSEGNSLRATKRKPQTGDKLGAAVGMDRRTLEKAREVVASGNRGLIDDMNRTGRVSGAYNRQFVAHGLQILKLAAPSVLIIFVRNCGQNPGD